MHRILTLTIVVALAACAAEPAKPDPAAEQRNQALIKQHNEIWALMGLSQKAQAELNAIVVGVNSNIMKNKAKDPNFEKTFAHPKRAEKMDHDAYLAGHKKRFDGLKITADTQKELFAAAEFVWQALHDPEAAKKFNEEQRKTAQTIGTMMKQLNGPPPCCDDSIFDKAKGN